MKPSLEVASTVGKLEESSPKKPRSSEATARPGEALRFHDAVAEWLDLTHELNDLTKGNWKEVRTKSETQIGLSRADRLKLIAQGKAVDLMAAAPKVEDVRLAKLKGRLRELDAEIAAFRESEDLRLEVSEMFRRGRAQEAVGRELDALETVADQGTKAEFDLLKRTHGKIGEPDRALLTELAEEQVVLDARRTEIENCAETALAARLHELRDYQTGLATERFAETPSRRVLLDKIRRHWEEGKNVLLTGPTGTGKTELLVHEGQKLHGAPPEIVRCSDRTGPAEIFGKSLLRASGGATETYYQPGRYVSAIDSGRPVVFDEFNLLEPKSRLQLKELYNRKPGDTVVIQEDTGKPHRIQEGFGFAATANIKGEKHKERFELDPAETRVFEQVKVDYLPKEEMYDLALAKLMDKRGGVRLSAGDAGETLKHLAEAAEMIQGAYLGTQTSFYDDAVKKKAAVLEKAVLDPGRVLSMLEGWEAASAKGASFQQFLNDRLLGFMNAEDLPEKDRRLLLKILVSKGFLAGRQPAEINVPGLKKTDLVTLGWKEKEAVEESAKPPVSYLRPEEVAKLDPFGIRKQKLLAIGDEFLGEVAGPQPGVHEPRVEQLAGLQEAREILGQDVLGPEEIETAFGFRPADIPPLPYSRAELEKAKQLGEMLVLRTNKDVTGAPFTMKSLQQTMSLRLQQAGKGKVLYDTDWYKNEDFFIKDTPKIEWRLVSKDVLPDSTSKDYVDQTKVLRDHLQKDGLLTPVELAECSDVKLEELRTLMGSDWQVAAKQLSELQVNQNHRRTPVEALYDLLARFGSNDERLLEAKYEWTSRLNSDGELVDVGHFDADGASVHGSQPGSRSSSLGACSSR